MTLDSLVQSGPELAVPGLPQHILDTYARLWQFETWLRRLVYIELRAFAGDDWAFEIQNAAENSKKSDKRLSHMPIPDESLLSYAQLSKLLGIICKNWRLFEPFLPPKSIWGAKLEEVTQIRHRIAHFRSVHRNDCDRVVQLLRDIDRGFWQFCTSYNDPHPVLPPSDDPVVEHFLHLDLFPWQPVGENKWAQYGIADPQARLSVTVEALCRPWASWSTPVAGKEGLIYNVVISARLNGVFNYQHFLERTSDLHEHIVHICFEGRTLFRVTLPALLGTDKIIRIVERIVTASRNCLMVASLGGSDNDSLKMLANEWPEYVLGSEDPLTFLTPDMPCSLFGI